MERDSQSQGKRFVKMLSEGRKPDLLDKIQKINDDYDEDDD